MKQRVVAYARVSTSKQSQEHSIEFQKNYWNDTLGNNPNYEFLGVYADKGISGKFVNRRPQFMLMMQAAQNGQIDLIFCKSVQRFARNTEELLSYVRELRDLGVYVVFEKENINTQNIDSDLYLTIAAAVAEDDLTRYSQNVTWSLQDKYAKGEVTMGGSLYGYFIGKNATFKVNPTEAEVVKRIYKEYLENKSCQCICDELNKEGIKGPSGGIWHRSTLNEILCNEKYIGDCLLQKSIYSHGTRKKNNGERDQYYVENHHKPIIDKETWNQVRQMMEERSNSKLRGRARVIYPFTGLIICGDCGKIVFHKMNHSGYDQPEAFWRCPEKRDKCSTTMLRNCVLEEKFIEAYNEFVTNKYKGEEESDIQSQIDSIAQEQKELVRLEANGWIRRCDFDLEFKKLEDGIKELQDKIESIKMRKISDKDYKPITVFDETKVEKFLKKVVLKVWKIEFHFYNGVVIEKDYNNRYPHEIRKRRR